MNMPRQPRLIEFVLSASVAIGLAGVLAISSWKHNPGLQSQSVSAEPKSDRSVRIIPFSKKEDKSFFPSFSGDQFVEHRTILPPMVATPDPKPVKTIPFHESQVTEQTSHGSDEKEYDKPKDHVIPKITKPERHAEENDICARHQLKKIWYDNRRRWRCSRE